MILSCDQIRDKLVDFTDGELSVDESRDVVLHLAQCEKCRQVVAGLRRSLHLAQVVWQDNLPETRPASVVEQSQIVWRQWLRIAVAAAIVVVAGGVVSVVSLWRSRPSLLTYEQVDRQATRAAAAAKLLAATQILAKCEGTESMVERQRAYILSQYAETPAAAKIKTNDHLNLGEIEHD